MGERVIWKFEIRPDAHEVVVPAGAEPLSVGVQCRRVVMWAAVDPDAPSQRLEYCVVMTGSSRVPDGLRFLGTVQLDNEWPRIVVHVYVAASPHPEPEDGSR